MEGKILLTAEDLMHRIKVLEAEIRARSAAAEEHAREKAALRARIDTLEAMQSWKKP